MEAVPQQDNLFAEASAAFAVDVSGSTHGMTLLAEKNFVRMVADLLSGQAQAKARVLPWNSSMGDVSPIAALDSLKSGGQTRPSVLLTNKFGREALLSSTVWFLMTDGLISERQRLDFAEEITTAGIHGTTCITIIFGYTDKSPIKSNISVGASAFTLCPDSLFLYYDIATHNVLIMQTKGIFNTLLKGEDSPAINVSSTWASFPKLSLKDLSDIIVPAPKRLGKNEVQLQDSLLINFDDLWANSLDKDSVDRIFSNPDNLRTVVMQSQGQNKIHQFQHWAQQQQSLVQDPLWKARIDVGGRARLAFEERKDAISQASGASLAALKWKLRMAHDQNMKNFLQSCQEERVQSLVRNSTIQAADIQSLVPIDSPESLSSTSPRRSRDRTHTPWPAYEDSITNTAGTSQGSPQDWTDVARNFSGSYWSAQVLQSPGTEPNFSSNNYPSVMLQSAGDTPMAPPEILTTHSATQGFLWTPGFRQVKDSGMKPGHCKGACFICGATDTQLALLFGLSPSYRRDGRHPALKHCQTGNPPKNPWDVWDYMCAEARPVAISWVSCDPCSTYEVDGPIGGSKVSLPVVEFRSNQEAYKKRLALICEGLVERDYHPIAFLNVMLELRNAHAKSSSTRPMDMGLLTTIRAETAVIANLLSDIVVTKPGLPTVTSAATGMETSSLGALLRQAVYATSDGFASPSLLDCSMRAFVISFQLAIEAPPLPIPAGVKRAAVLNRYLFAMAEHYVVTRGSQLSPAKDASVEDDTELVMVDIPNEVEAAAAEGEARTSIPPPKNDKIAHYRELGVLREFGELEMSGLLQRATAVVSAALQDISAMHVYGTTKQLFELVSSRVDVRQVMESARKT